MHLAINIVKWMIINLVVLGYYQAEAINKILILS